MKFLALGIAIVLVFAACTPVVAPPVEEEEDLPEGDFSIKTTPEGIEYFEGTLPVKGYATVEKLEEGFCTENCTVYDYVVFHVTEVTNAHYAEFMSQMTGNTFAGGGQIGLGCLQENGTVFYENATDDAGEHAGLIIHTISASDVSKILDSSPTDPVVISLLRKKFTSGFGAPTCYNHFAEVVVE